ncbi:MAG: hypothetical protein HUJ54_13455 [Erysipelotrichaceae bacterium]|nr:hypothetical protein [Erysipelotrichaceae bacterium]
MKKNFAKSAAALAAAGLMTFGAVPVCAEESCGNKETQYIHEFHFYDHYDPSIIDVWKNADCHVKLDPKDIKIGGYYIYKTLLFSDEMPDIDFRLIRIDNIYQYTPCNRFFYPRWTAEYTDIQTHQTGTMKYEDETLYYPPGYKSVTAFYPNE